MITFEKDTQTLLKIVPSREVKNGYNVFELIKAMNELENEWIYVQDRKLHIRKRTLSGYEIYMTESNIQFTITIPTRYKQHICNKIERTWKNVAVSETDDYLDLFNDKQTMYCDVNLKYNSLLPISTNYTENKPLDSIMSLKHDLKDDDKLVFQMLFMPANDDWQAYGQQALSRYKEGSYSFRKEYVSRFLDWVSDSIEFLFEMLSTLMGVGTMTDDDFRRKKLQNVDPKLVDACNSKLRYAGFKTYIRVISYSNDELRRYMNMKNCVIALKALDGINEFEAGNAKSKPIKLKRGRGLYSTIFDNSILNMKEMGQIMQLPTVGLQNDFGIEAIDKREIQVPQEMTMGTVPICKVDYKGNIKTTYWNTRNDNVFTLPKLFIGIQGSGKTEELKRFIVETAKIGQAIIHMDFIQENEASTSIESKIDPNRVVVVDFADAFKTISLAYNEAYDNWDDNDLYFRKDVANKLANNVKYLLNSITMDTTQPMSNQMLRYLQCACRVVFIHKDKTINEVFRVLNHHGSRKYYIDKAIESGIYKDNDEDINALRLLDRYNNKGKVVGTNEDRIQRIMDRVASLHMDFRISEMLKNEIDESFNFNKWIDEGKVVFIRIPESVFPDKGTRDVIVTFLVTKLWFAKKIAKKQKMAHLILDEVHHLRTTLSFLVDNIAEFRRYKLGTVFAAHYMEQFGPLLPALKNVGSSYRLLAPISSSNVKHIESLLQDFTKEELLTIKTRHSFNIINYDNQYISFIGEQLPMV